MPDTKPSPIYTLTPSEVEQLAVLAIEAKKKAYCPYSEFRVGASLLLAQESGGTYHQGSNVEVASTPVGICAERCALFPVVASFERPKLPVVRGLAVSTDIWPPASPCGMCRQMIREFCEPDMKIYMFGRKSGTDYSKMSAKDEANGESVIMTIGELLPMSFGPNDMDKREKKADPGPKFG